MRIGIGYDVHRLSKGRKLFLGGYEIPGSEYGLEGHSDADALMHAVCDALLGAAGQADLGQLFPDSDAQWKGAPSRVFLGEALRRVAEAGFELGNLDCVIVTEKPKLAPHYMKIRESLATLMGVSLEQVNVKAKTNEKLGYVGAEEALEANCVALLKEARDQDERDEGDYS